jgi:hypothetical protein
MEADGYLWRDKMDEYGNKLKWEKFAALSLESFKEMALKHSFERNFIKDSWNLEVQNKQQVLAIF